MNESAKLPKRKNSLRLDEYDYSQNNAYYVTICTKDRESSINTNEISSIIRQVWENLPDHYDNIILDEFVVMPNHVHGIIIINNRSNDGCRRGVQLNARPGPQEGVLSNAPTNNFYSKISPRKNTLSVIIRTFKATVTTLCRKKGIAGFRWQRNYYEHVIRNDDDLYRTRKYIRENPLKWELDEENPVNLINICRGANGYVPGYRGAG